LLVEVIPRVESVESLVADRFGYETETRLVSFTHWQKKPYPVLPLVSSRSVRPSDSS
jgi:hypothetical protein